MKVSRTISIGGMFLSLFFAGYCLVAAGLDWPFSWVVWLGAFNGFLAAAGILVESTIRSMEAEIAERRAAERSTGPA